MATKWTIYHNPQCSKSRSALKILQEHGLEPEIREYLKIASSLDEIIRLLQLAGIEPGSFLRKNESEFAAYKKRDLTDIKAVAQIIHECPRLLERPIVVKDDQVIIARPPEKVEELL